MIHPRSPDQALGSEKLEGNNIMNTLKNYHYWQTRFIIKLCQSPWRFLSHFLSSPSLPNYPPIPASAEHHSHDWLCQPTSTSHIASHYLQAMTQVELAVRQEISMKNTKKYWRNEHWMNINAEKIHFLWEKNIDCEVQRFSDFLIQENLSLLFLQGT